MSCGVLESEKKKIMSDATHNDLSSERETETSRELLKTPPEPSPPTHAIGRAELVAGPARRRSLFERLPWEKALIWGLSSSPST